MSSFEEMSMVISLTFAVLFVAFMAYFMCLCLFCNVNGLEPAEDHHVCLYPSECSCSECIEAYKRIESDNDDITPSISEDSAKGIVLKHEKLAADKYRKKKD